MPSMDEYVLVFIYTIIMVPRMIFMTSDAN